MVLPKYRLTEDGEQPVIYPADAVRVEVEGTVKLKMVIGTDGSVKECEAIDDGGDNRLLRASVEGLRRAGFTPGSVNGTPTEMHVIVEVTFALGEEMAEISFMEAPDVAEASEIKMPKDFLLKAPAEEPDREAFVSNAVYPTYDMGQLKRLLRYPETARANGIEGTVTVSAQIGMDGEVLKVIIRSSSHRIFEAEAKRAVGELTFTPARQNGKPIKRWATFKIEFQLEDPEPDSVEMTGTDEKEYGMDDDVPDATPPGYDSDALRNLLEYPELARQNGLEGKVTISVKVDVDGKALDVVARETTHPIFIDHAVDAARRLQYTPGMQNGKPIRMWVEVVVTFKLGS